jgi:riboflavin synthase
MPRRSTRLRQLATTIHEKTKNKCSLAIEVLLIPHTLKVTTWGDRKAGDKVNIEVDQMARYAARLLETGRGT